MSSSRATKLKSSSGPDVPSLEKATLALLRRGVQDSDIMREQLRGQFGLTEESDERWRKFVNNHAWALVRLQDRGEIHKTGLRQYKLGLPHGVPPIDGKSLPPWAKLLVGRANSKNKNMLARWGSAPPFQDEDLIAIWKAGKGRCMLSGLPFTDEQVGGGKASHPYRPSLDRIDPHKPYTRENCRLVLQVVNFALNAYGDDGVFYRIAEAATKFLRRQARRGRGTTFLPATSTSRRSARRATYSTRSAK